MDQIETLKWIAENGNPIGTPAEADYLKHKSDSTFRNLAMSLAESETGYAGLNDSIKNAYQEYKSKITAQPAPTVKQQPEPEQGYFAKAFEYARGEEQEDPNLLGRFWRGGGTGVQRMVERQIETIATIGTAFLPIAWPSVLAGGALTGTGTALDAIHNKDITTEDVKESTLYGALGSGIGVGLGKLGKWFSSPVAKELEAYELASQKQALESSLARRQNTKNLIELQDIRRGQKAIESELSQPLTENEILGTLPKATSAQQALVASNEATAREMSQRATLDAIKEHIVNKYPEKYEQFADAFKMSDDEALNYFLNLQKEIPIPAEVARPDFSVPAKALASKLPYSGMRYVAERLPVNIPSSVIERGAKAARFATHAQKLSPATIKALESLLSRRDLTETEYSNIRNILNTDESSRTTAQKQYLSKYGY